MRWWTHGDVAAVQKIMPAAGAVHDFYYGALAYEGDDCIVWPFSRNNKGYPEIYIGGAKFLVNRLVCWGKNGPPPSETHQAAHSCANGHLGCITPNHLAWATALENTCDMVRHGHSTRGERSANARLCQADVLNMFRRCGE